MREAPADALGEESFVRLEADVAAALRRRPAQEARLAGVLRALCPHSPELKAVLGAALDTLVRRGSYDRPLYAAVARSLAEHDERRASAPLSVALGDEEAGGLATLSAACFSTDAAIGEALAKVATSRHPHLAFAAEVARVSRRESDGEHVASLAPMIKESHRIALCVELLVPLLWWRPMPLGIAPALAVLRDAERHLGRWLVLGEIAVRAGDRRPLEEARERAAHGPQSARAAWSMVAWALSGPDAPAPSARPTVEIVARLSDRPSADRDPTFLYRLAAARVASARPMLENLVRSSRLGDATAIRAALYLARDHGRADLLKLLAEAARSPRREALRGLAAAALFDAGERELAMSLADELAHSRQLSTLAWGTLLRVAARGRIEGEVLAEPAYRWIQLGWVE